MHPQNQPWRPSRTLNASSMARTTNCEPGNTSTAAAAGDLYSGVTLREESILKEPEDPRKFMRQFPCRQRKAITAFTRPRRRSPGTAEPSSTPTARTELSIRRTPPSTHPPWLIPRSLPAERRHSLRHLRVQLRQRTAQHLPRQLSKAGGPLPLQGDQYP